MAKKYPPEFTEFLSALYQAEYEFGELGGIQKETIEKINLASLKCGIPPKPTEFLVANFTKRIKDFEAEVEKFKLKFPNSPVADLQRCKLSEQERKNNSTDYLLRARFKIK